MKIAGCMPKTNAEISKPAGKDSKVLAFAELYAQMYTDLGHAIYLDTLVKCQRADSA